jgi:hypothetical protein
MALIARFRRAIERLVTDPPRFWTPSALDPYGVLPIMDALHAGDAEDGTAGNSLEIVEQTGDERAA